jgi:hypothetical protein
MRAHLSASFLGALALLTHCAPSPAPTGHPRADVVPRVDAAPVDAGVPVEAAAPEAIAHDTLPAWTEPPADSSVLVFREVLVGALPFPSRRNTWTLIVSGRRVIVRFEAQWAKESIAHLDRTSQDPDRWMPADRVEYTGEAARSAPLAATLTRRLGADEIGPSEHRRIAVPKTLSLQCAVQAIRVHPAFATLVEGWKNDDDSMEPAAWAPPRTEPVANATACKVDGLTLAFTGALYFARGRKTAKEETVGVEWAFVNSDMVVQEGGFRWIPAFSVK